MSFVGNGEVERLVAETHFGYGFGNAEHQNSSAYGNPAHEAYADPITYCFSRVPDVLSRGCYSHFVTIH